MSDRYEKRDADSVSLALIALALMIGGTLVLLTCFLVLRGLDRSQGVTNDSLAVASVSPAREFPQPRLEVAPTLSLEAFRARDAQEMNTYGWIDRDRGVVQIPIERAMALLAERGLPVTTTDVTPVELLQQRATLPKTTPEDATPPQP